MDEVAKMATAAHKEVRGAPPVRIERSRPTLECRRLNMLVVESGVRVDLLEKVKAITPRTTGKRKAAASGNIGAKMKGKGVVASVGTGVRIGGKAKAAMRKTVERATAPGNMDSWGLPRKRLFRS